MNDAICQAIAALKIITLRYDGYTRAVEPHAYGVTRKGHEILRCWQIAGGSVSNEPLGWKLLRLDETTGLQVERETFQGPRPDYKRGDKAMRTIYAQL